MRKLDFHVERRFLSRDECNRVAGAALRFRPGRTAGKGARRNCLVAGIRDGVEGDMSERVRRLMRAVYPKLVRGWMELEPMQLLLYPATLAGGGSYTWHMDKGRYFESSISGRRVSATIQLTDPAEYEGGDLQFNLGDVYPAPREQGCVIVFPSYVLHQVTPVRFGVRRAIAAWIGE